MLLLACWGSLTTSYGFHLLLLKVPYLLYISDNERYYEIEIPEIDLDTFELILDFVYTGEISISEYTLHDLMAHCKVMKLKHLEKGCEEALVKFLNTSNWFEFQLAAGT